MKKKLLLISIIFCSFYSHAQWVQQATGFSSPRGLQSIDIVDANVVWALAVDGSEPKQPVQEYTRTTNGGTTWTAGSIDAAKLPGMNYIASAITAVDANTAWVAMHDTVNDVGAIFKTINGGTTWLQVTDTAVQFRKPGYVNIVHFWDANNGFAMGDPTNKNPFNEWGFEIIVTTDGGSTWQHIDPGSAIPYNKVAEFGIVDDFTTLGDSSVWFGTSMGRIYKSTDRARTWSVSTTTPFDTLTVVADISFKDELNGLAVGHLFRYPYTYKGIIKTSDGGNTWSSLTTNPVGGFTIINSIAYIPGTAGAYIITGSHNSSYTGNPNDKPGSAYTLDDGQTWINLDTIGHQGIELLDLNTGWSGGFNSNATTGGIFKWTNNNVVPSVDALAREENRFTVFPNPAKDIINIAFLTPGAAEGSIIISDVLGRTVFSGKLKDNSIDVSAFNSGVYFLSVSTEAGIATKKIVIK